MAKYKYYKPCLKQEQKEILNSIKSENKLGSIHEALDFLLQKASQLDALKKEMRGNKLVAKKTETIELDNKQQQRFFEKSNATSLKDKTYTEKELVEEAIKVSGKSKDQFTIDSLLEHSKKELATSMSDRSIASMLRIEKTYKMMNEQGVRITPGGLRKAAQTNANTILKWANINNIQFD